MAKIPLNKVRKDTRILGIERYNNLRPVRKDTRILGIERYNNFRSCKILCKKNEFTKWVSRVTLDTHFVNKPFGLCIFWALYLTHALETIGTAMSETTHGGCAAMGAAPAAAAASAGVEAGGDRKSVV